MTRLTWHLFFLSEVIFVPRSLLVTKAKWKKSLRRDAHLDSLAVSSESVEIILACKQNKDIG